MRIPRELVAVIGEAPLILSHWNAFSGKAGRCRLSHKPKDLAPEGRAIFVTSA